MDFVRELGLLALGSRLRRLSDRFMTAVQEIYRVEQVDFEPRWFPCLRLLADEGPKTVGEAAHALGVSHASVSQCAKAMQKRGLLVFGRDARDDRRRVLSLSDDGRNLVDRLCPLWEDLQDAVREIANEGGVDILTALDGVEHALDHKGLEERVADRRRERQMGEVEILEFRPELKDCFRTLNLEWIERYYSVEPADREILWNPERAVLASGGQIFFARLDGEVVGTCAMLKVGDRRFELTKMGVTRAYQGRQIGKRLLLAALDWARASGASSVVLITNSSLVPAITLYRKLGFEVTHSGMHPKYERADLIMELTFNGEGPSRGGPRKATLGDHVREVLR